MNELRNGARLINHLVAHEGVDAWMQDSYEFSPSQGVRLPTPIAEALRRVAAGHGMATGPYLNACMDEVIGRTLARRDRLN